MGNLWLPSHFSMAVKSRVLFASRRSTDDETYSNYRPATGPGDRTSLLSGAGNPGRQADGKSPRICADSYARWQQRGCVASTVFNRFPDLAKILEGPSIGHFSRTIKHAVCSEYRRCNTSSRLLGHSKVQCSVLREARASPAELPSDKIICRLR